MILPGERSLEEQDLGYGKGLACSRAAGDDREVREDRERGGGLLYKEVLPVSLVLLA